jgi:hypothetical protein|uniref:Uncharacterized protein n=1 Tax=Zea mays TaxID=4577 RepID=A0A804M3C4_MAIZE
MRIALSSLQLLRANCRLPPLPHAHAQRNRRSRTPTRQPPARAADLAPATTFEPPHQPQNPDQCILRAATTAADSAPTPPAMARNGRLPTPAEQPRRNLRAPCLREPHPSRKRPRRAYANPTPAANVRAARTPRNPLLPPPEIAVISLRRAGSVCSPARDGARVEQPPPLLDLATVLVVRLCPSPST